jgi:hypothetical protein
MYAVPAPMTTPRKFSAAAGAYGFRLSGLAGAAALLVDAPETWPRLDLVRVTPHGLRPETEQVTEDGARLWLPGGAWATLDRERSSAQLAIPDEITDGALVHPYLAPVALVMARWFGREGFHGGGIVAGDGVWGVLGDKTAGKSTMLTWLAREGVGVVSDDVLVIDGRNALAGPRSVDLREEAAGRLGVGEPMGRVGLRERWRFTLPPVAPELPLRGWITLEWGDEIAVEPIRGSDRLPALIPHRGVRLPPLDPAVLVHFSALPHLRFIRPRDWNALPGATARLLDAIAAQGDSRISST